MGEVDVEVCVRKPLFNNIGEFRAKLKTKEQFGSPLLLWKVVLLFVCYSSHFGSNPLPPTIRLKFLEDPGIPGGSTTCPCNNEIFETREHIHNYPRR